MKASIDKTWNSAFVLTQQDLKQISLIFKSHNIEPLIRVECFSGLSLKPAGFDQLSDLNNSGMSAIKSVRFSSPYDSAIGLIVEFGCNNFETIRLSVSGEQQEVVSIDASVTDIVLSASKWYGQLARSHTPTQFVIYVLGSILGLMLAARNHQSVGIALLVVSLLGVISPAKAFLWLCPLGLFDVGKGSQEIKVYAQRRSQFGFVGLVLALFVSIVSTYIVHRFGF